MLFIQMRKLGLGLALLGDPQLGSEGWWWT